MGCDIHLHAEVKIGGKWHHYSAPSIRRNYAMFAYMADVRGDGVAQPISKPRGLPADVTDLTRFDSDRWECDGHSHSWIGAEEIAALVNRAATEGWCVRDTILGWDTENFGYLFGNHWSGFMKYPEDRPDGLEDIRFVFWFDN